MPQTNYSAYRYLLHMPGSATGSYSRNLQYLWCHGSIVLIWNHSATEWYYRYLQDGVHFASVDKDTFRARLDAIDGDPALQERLRQGARDFYEAHLASSVLVDRWQAVLDALDGRQDATEPKIPRDTACTCDAALQATYVACDQCDVTRMKGDQVARHVGILARGQKARQ